MSDLTIICPTEEELQMATQRNLKCSVSGCGRHFSTLSAMWMHCAKTHKIYNDKWHEDACSGKKQIRSKSVRYFVCPIADCSRGQNKPFDRFTNLKMHYINKHAEKKFSCEKCGNKFGSSSYLEIHVTRCGQMFMCSCGVHYTTPEALYMHAKRRDHELTREFKESRKYIWKRKDLEAESKGEPVPHTNKRRPSSKTPLLPRGPVFILHETVTPVKVTTSTQTEKKHGAVKRTNTKRKQISDTHTRKQERAVPTGDGVESNGKRRPLSLGNDKCVGEDLQKMYTSRETTGNSPYQVVQVMSGDQTPHQQSSGQYVPSTVCPSVTTTPVCSGVGGRFNEPIHQPVLTSQGLSQLLDTLIAMPGVISTPIVQGNRMMSFSGTQQTFLESILPCNPDSNAIPSSAPLVLVVYPNNVGSHSSSVGHSHVGCTTPVVTSQLTNPMVPVSNMLGRSDESTATLNSLTSVSSATDSNDSINFRSIGTTFETLGVPTQTDFNILDLFESCDIQTQTRESIFSCSPVMMESSATQTQEQRNKSMMTSQPPTNDAETLVNSMLEVTKAQTTMQTQTFTEQSTMETQTTGMSLPSNMRTVELQTMTHSSIATSPFSQPIGSNQQGTQDTQTMGALSSQDLLSLDIYTQTALNDLTNNHLDDLEFSDIHTQTVDGFDLDVFGINVNSSSERTSLPLERGEGSITVGTQVQSQFLKANTVSTNVQTDNTSADYILSYSDFPS